MSYGDIILKYEEKGFVKKHKSRKFNLSDQIRFRIIPQPTCFWRLGLFKDIGYLDESYHYIFDVEYWIRAGYHARIKYFPMLLACFRIHAKAKTSKNTKLAAQEGVRMYEKLFSDPHTPRNILKLRRIVLEYWYERLALKYFEEGLNLQARRSFWKAILLTPWRIQNLTLVMYIVDTLCTTNFGYSIQKLSFKLRRQVSELSKAIK